MEAELDMYLSIILGMIFKMERNAATVAIPVTGGWLSLTLSLVANSGPCANG